MRIFDLHESSDLTFDGSNTPDLIASKVWLCNKLKDLVPEFSTIYVLGSWYGNMGLVLLDQGIPFNKLINVDTNKEYITASEKLLKDAGIGNRLESMIKDANQLDYRQIDSDGLIINTSVQDIKGSSWWKNIPKGVMIALQDRNATKLSQHKDLASFDQAFPMSQTLYLGQKQLEDPEIEYLRFMKIGVK
jgi:hypothetical protein